MVESRKEDEDGLCVSFRPLCSSPGDDTWTYFKPLSAVDSALPAQVLSLRRLYLFDLKHATLRLFWHLSLHPVRCKKKTDVRREGGAGV